MSLGRSPVRRDHHALAGGESVVLHDVRRTELIQSRRDLGRSLADPCSRGRYARQQPSRPWQRPCCPRGLGSLLGGAEARDPDPAYRVGGTRDQRRLGPTTTRSTPRSAASVATASGSPAATGWLRPTCAVPGLPGAL